MDALPIGLRGWCISNVRIWTGIVQEEIDRFEESEKARASATAAAVSKSASPVVRGETPTKGSKEQEADLVPKKEGDKPNSPKGTPGVEEVDSPGEEGKYSSGSKQPKEEKTPKKRSRSARKRDRSRSRRSRRRRRRSSSRRSRHAKEDQDKKKEQSEKGKEKKAKPSVRPPRTPSRSPPGDREAHLLSNLQWNDEMDHQIQLLDPQAGIGVDLSRLGIVNPSIGGSTKDRKRRRPSTTIEGSRASSQGFDGLEKTGGKGSSR